MKNGDQAEIVGAPKVKIGIVPQPIDYLGTGRSMSQARPGHLFKRLQGSSKNLYISDPAIFVPARQPEHHRFQPAKCLLHSE